MSHFATYQFHINNIEHIKRALVEMGLGYAEQQTILDWAKQRRQVDLAVTKDSKVLPIGWIKKGSELDFVYEWFRVPLQEKTFMSQLNQLHAKYQVMDSLEENRWNIGDISINANGEIEIMASMFN